MLYLDLFLTFFRIGLFTFGGGYAMLPLISEAALSKAWVTEETMLNFIAVSESTPGPFALNIATFIGTEQAGILGALCATAGVVMPSFIVILIVANFYLAFRKNKIVANVLYGIRPVVIGLLTATVLSVGQSTLFPNGFVFDVKLLISLAIAIVCFIVIKKKVHPIIPLLSSAAVGVLLGWLGVLG